MDDKKVFFLNKFPAFMFFQKKKSPLNLFALFYKNLSLENDWNIEFRLQL